jgi:branched-chain amino acid aminotransferase
MIVFNGSVYAHINSLPEDELNGLLHFGISIVENIRVEAEKLIFWESHYFKMMASMRILRMEIPMSFTMEYLEEQIIKLLQENKLNTVSSKISLSFFSKHIPTRCIPIVPTSFLIEAETSETFSSIQLGSRNIELYKDHWVVKGLFGTLESSNDRMRKLAAVYAYENNFEDLILLNEDKQVSETLIGSLFVVQGDVIKTPPLTSGCRSTVYRQVVIDLLKKIEGVDLIEETVSPFELQKADELFVVSLSNGIQSVKQYRKKVFSSNKATLLFPKFMTNYRLS